MRLRRFSPATMIACFALFVAVGGTAIAGARYVITRKSQIKPSVLSTIETDGPYERVSSQETRLKPGEHIEVRAQCPPDDHIVTGGYFVKLAAGAYVKASQPYGSSGWTVLIEDEQSAGVTSVLADALCAPGRTAVQLEN